MDKEEEELRTANSKIFKYFTGKRNKNEFKEKYDSTTEDENNKQIQNFSAPNFQSANKYDGDIKIYGNPTDKTHLLDCEETIKKSKLKIPKYLKIGGLKRNLTNNSYASNRQNKDHKQISAAVNLQDANKSDGDIKKDGIPKDKTHVLDCEKTNKKSKLKIPKYLKIGRFSENLKNNSYVSTRQNENRKQNSAAVNLQDPNKSDGDIKKDGIPKDITRGFDCKETDKKSKLKIPNYLKIGGLKKHSKKNRYVSITDDENREHIKNSAAISFQGINQYGNEKNKDRIPKGKADILSCDKSNKKRKMKIPKYPKIEGFKGNLKNNSYVSNRQNGNHKQNSASVNFQDSNKSDGDIKKDGIPKDKTHLLEREETNKRSKLKIPKYLKIRGFKGNLKNNSYVSNRQNESHKQNSAAVNFQDVNKCYGDINVDGIPKDKTHLLDCEETNKKKKMKVPNFLKIRELKKQSKKNRYVSITDDENHEHIQNVSAINFQDIYQYGKEINKDGTPKDKADLLSCEKSNKKREMKFSKYLKIGGLKKHSNKNSFHPLKKHSEKNRYVSITDDENRKHIKNSAAINFQGINQYGNDINKDGIPKDKADLLSCDKSNKKRKMKIPKYLKIGGLKKHSNKNSLHPLKKHSKENRYVSITDDENRKHIKNSAAINFQGINQYGNDINKDGIPKDKADLLSCDKSNKKRKMKIPKYVKIGGLKKHSNKNSLHPLKKHSKENRYVSITDDENRKHIKNSAAINFQGINQYGNDINKDGIPKDKADLLSCDKSNKKRKMKIPKYLKIGGLKKHSNKNSLHPLKKHSKENRYVSITDDENRKHIKNSAAINFQGINQYGNDINKDGIPKDKADLLSCDKSNKKRKMKIPKYLKIGGLKKHSNKNSLHPLKKHSKENRYVSITDDENRKHIKNSAAINFQGINQYGNDINKDGIPKDKADLLSCDKSNKKRKMKIPKYLKIGGLKKHSNKNSLHPLKKHSKENRYVSITDDENRKHIKNSAAINFQGINQYGNDINKDGIPKDKADLLSCDKSNKKRKMKIPKYLKIGGLKKHSNKNSLHPLKKHSKENRYVSITDDENRKHIKNSAAINFQGINQYGNDINKDGIPKDKADLLSCDKSNKKRKMKIPKYLKIGGLKKHSNKNSLHPLKKHSKENRYVSITDDENRKHIKNSAAINFQGINQYGNDINKDGIPEDKADLLSCDKSNKKRKMKIPKYLKIRGFKGNLKNNSYVSNRQNESHKQNSAAVNFQDVNKCYGDINVDGIPKDKTHLLDCEETNKKKKMKVPNFLKIRELKKQSKKNRYVSITDDENHEHIQNVSAINFQDIYQYGKEINKDGTPKDKADLLSCEKSNKKREMKFSKYLKIGGLKKHSNKNSFHPLKKHSEKNRYVSITDDENRKHIKNSAAINFQGINQYGNDINKDGIPKDKADLLSCDKSNKKRKMKIPKYLKIGGLKKHSNKNSLHPLKKHSKENRYVSITDDENRKHIKNSAAINFQGINQYGNDINKDGIPKDKADLLSCDKSNKKRKMKIPKYVKIGGLKKHSNKNSLHPLKKHSKENRYVSITDDENRKHIKNSAAINFQGINQYGNDINKDGIPKDKADLLSCDKSNKKRKMKIPKYLKIGGLKKHSNKNSLHPLKKHSKENRYVSITDDENRKHIKNSAAINFQGINQYGNDINKDGIPKDKADLLSCDKSNKKRKMKIPKYLKIGGLKKHSNKNSLHPLKKHSKENRYVSITDDENRKHIKNSAAINFQGINQYGNDINKDGIPKDKADLLSCDKSNKKRKMKIPKYLKIGGLKKHSNKNSLHPLKKHSKENRYVSITDDENRKHIKNSAAINFQGINQYGNDINKDGIPEDKADLLSCDKSNKKRKMKIPKYLKIGGLKKHSNKNSLHPLKKHSEKNRYVSITDDDNCKHIENSVVINFRGVSQYGHKMNKDGIPKDKANLFDSDKSNWRRSEIEILSSTATESEITGNLETSEEIDRDECDYRSDDKTRQHSNENHPDSENDCDIGIDTASNSITEKQIEIDNMTEMRSKSKLPKSIVCNGCGCFRFCRFKKSETQKNQSGVILY